MGYGIRTGMEYENYFLQRDGTPLFGGYHIFNPVRNVYHPVVLDLLEQLPKVGHRPDHGERGVRPRPVRAQLRAGRRARRARQELHVQERRQGDRAQARPDRHVHVEADQRPRRLRRAPPPVAARPRRQVRDGRRRRRVGPVRGREAVHRGQPQVREGRLHAARADRELLQAPPAAHVRAVEHLVGPRGPLGADPHQGRHGGAPGTSSTAPPSGMSNPYMVAAGVLAAGLLGIREGLELEPPSGPGPGRGRPEVRAAAVDAARGARPVRALRAASAPSWATSSATSGRRSAATSCSGSTTT